MNGRRWLVVVGALLVQPCLGAIYGWGVFVPHALTWALEHAEEPAEAPRFRRLPHLGELTRLIEEIG